MSSLEAGLLSPVYVRTYARAFQIAIIDHRIIAAIIMLSIISQAGTGAGSRIGCSSLPYNILRYYPRSNK